MRLRLFLFCLLVCLSTLVRSQPLASTWHDTGLRSGDIVKLLGTPDKRLFVFIRDGKQLTMDRYNADMQKAFSVPIAVKYDAFISGNAKFKAEAFAMVGGKIYMFTSCYERATRSRYFFGSTLSQTGVFGSDLHLLSKIAGVSSDEGKFFIRLSEDSSLIFVGNTYKEEGKNTDRLIATVVKLPDYGVVWSKALSFPYQDRLANFTEATLDNNGNLAITARIKLSNAYNPHAHSFEADYRAALFFYDHKADSLTEHVIDMHGIYITSVAARFDDKNDLRVAGMFQSNPTSYFEGYFYFTIDGKTQEEKNKTTRVLPLFSMEAFDPRDLPDTYLDNVVPLPNGNTVLVAQQSYYSDTLVESTKYLRRYATGPIHLFCLKPDGSMAWFCSLPKRQYVDNNGEFVSYELLHRDNNLYFLYNDHEKNHDVTDPKNITTYKSSRNAETVVVKVDENGFVKKRTVAQQPDGKTCSVMPEQLTLLGDASVAVIAGRTTTLSDNHQEKFLTFDLDQP